MQMQHHEVPLKHSVHIHQKQNLRCSSSGTIGISTSRSLDQPDVLKALKSQRCWVAAAPTISFDFSVLTQGRLSEEMHLTSVFEDLMDSLISSELWVQLNLDIRLRSKRVTESGGLHIKCELYQKHEKRKALKGHTRFPYTLQTDDLSVEVLSFIPTFTLHKISFSHILEAIATYPPYERTVTVSNVSQGTKRKTSDSFDGQGEDSSPSSSPVAQSLFESSSSSCQTSLDITTSVCGSQCIPRQASSVSDLIIPRRSGVLDSLTLTSLMDCALRSIMFDGSPCPFPIARSHEDQNALSLAACAPAIFIPGYTADLSLRSQFISQASEGIASILENTTSEALKRKANLFQCSEQAMEVTGTFGGCQPGTNKERLRRLVRTALWAKLQRQCMDLKTSMKAFRILHPHAHPPGTLQNKQHDPFSDGLLICSEDPGPRPESNDGLLSTGFADDKPLDDLDFEDDIQESASDYEDSITDDMLVSLGACPLPKFTNEMDRLNCSSPPLLGVLTSECHRLLQTSSPSTGSPGHPSCDMLQRSSSPSLNMEQCTRESSPVLLVSDDRSDPILHGLEGIDPDILNGVCSPNEVKPSAKTPSTTLRQLLLNPGASMPKSDVQLLHEIE